jgi:hypothetical protein
VLLLLLAALVLPWYSDDIVVLCVDLCGVCDARAAGLFHLWHLPCLLRCAAKERSFIALFQFFECADPFWCVCGGGSSLYIPR